MFRPLKQHDGRMRLAVGAWLSWGAVPGLPLLPAQESVLMRSPVEGARPAGLAARVHSARTKSPLAATVEKFQ